MAFRSALSGPLFIHLDGSPLNRAFLVRAVREALRSTGVDFSRYNGHSFGIVAASTTARAGFSDSFIQMLGRWKYSAFLSYLWVSRSQLMNVSQQLLT
jgi:hypothetical protein